MQHKADRLRVAVIGGGAAGFFAALRCAACHQNSEVVLFEKTNKWLAKVKISGGGRCNVTHNCLEISKLAKHYPRGEKFLRHAFGSFAVADTFAWFAQRHVALHTEEDGRVFPESNDSQTVIDCFLYEAHKLGISLRLATAVQELLPLPNGKFSLVLQPLGNAEGKSKPTTEVFDKVIVASGGSPKKEGLQWLAALGHGIQEPVPSLFTFNIPNNPLTALMGVAVPTARVRIADTKLVQEGALLITHWGLSAYSILKLSAWGARLLAEKNYQFSVIVSWLLTHNEDQLRATLYALKQELASRQLGNKNPFNLPSRLWDFLLQKIAVQPQKRWADLQKQEINKLVQVLLYDSYEVRGKTTFKEEFVTCGGVELADVNPKTMESKHHKGLYFAGEVLDIDGITGGFNFQAAWSTGYVAGQLL
jgi:predicted Rossmann fold flavoprotein